MMVSVVREGEGISGVGGEGEIQRGSDAQNGGCRDM